MNNDKQLHDARIALANVLNNMSDNEIAEWFGGTEYAAMADTKSGMRMIHAIASAALENIAAPLVVKANADTASNTANTPAFGPNQARYEQCAKPHVSQLQANDALRQFLAHIGDVRAHYQIPEVIVVAAAYYGDEPGQTIVQASGFGDSRTHPELGALAFKIYTAPTIARAQRLQQMAAIVDNRNASDDGDDEDG